MRRLGQLPFDAEDTVAHGELSPFHPFTDQVHGLVAPMTAATVHLSVPISPLNPTPKCIRTHTHTRQGVSSRPPGHRPNRNSSDQGLAAAPCPRSLHYEPSMLRLLSVSSTASIRQKEELGVESGHWRQGAHTCICT